MGRFESALKLLPEKKTRRRAGWTLTCRHERIEAVRKLKSTLPATQFVMLTVYEDADHIYNRSPAVPPAFAGNRRRGTNCSVRWPMSTAGRR